MPKIFEYRGVSGLVAAEILEDSTENYTTGDVFEVAGVSQIQKETDSQEESHYYDNIAAIVISSTGADTITIDASAIPLDVLAKITGQTYDAAKGMFVEHERKSKYFALGYITKTTDGVEIFVFRNKGKFGMVGETNVTEDDGTTANGQQLTFTGVSTVHKFAAIGNIPCKSTVVDTSVNPIPAADFFATVQTPDTIQDAPIVVTGITVAPTTATLSLSGTATEQLTATLTPSGATGTVTWTSSDDTIATVSNAGLVTGVAVGNAVITATCETFTATCAVEVTA
jgi:phi13 family phage major tail protein